MQMEKLFSRQGKKRKWCY